MNTQEYQEEIEDISTDYMNELTLTERLSKAKNHYYYVKHKYGEESNQTIQAIFTYTDLLYENKNYTLAISLLARNLETCKNMYSEHHEFIGETNVRMGKAYLADHDYSFAVNHLIYGLEARKRYKGIGLDTYELYPLIAKCEAKIGFYDMAIKYQDELFDYYLNNYGMCSTTYEAFLTLTRYVILSGDEETALAYLSQVYDVVMKPEHQGYDTIYVLEEIADIYCSLGYLEDAIKYQEMACEWSIRAFEEDEVETKRMYCELDYYYALNRHSIN